jgi:NAD(P)-dependent dehydrogenase (short-subunit alcohol dehydrogenase family)
MSHTALITGGASGIGAATARLLDSRGWSVIIADVDGTRAAEVAATCGEQARSVALDVTAQSSVEAALGEIRGREERLDAVVTCAGVIDPRPSVDVSDTQWNDLMEVNLAGTFRVVREAHDLLAASAASSVVLVSSIAAHVGMRRRASYAASKGAVEALTRVLAAEWAADGIRVNAVAPGYVRTELVANAINDKAVDIEALQAAIPLGRLAAPSELGAAIAFLASDEASFITGQVLVVDGGMTIHAAW